MRHPLRTLALALAFAAAPACAPLPLEQARIERAAPAPTTEQHAFALLHAYAALLEEAADVVRDPVVPAEARQALGEAERAATPVVEALERALAAHVRARSARAEGEALAASERRLSEALAAALAHLAGLKALVHAPNG
jgi:uncharacterized damage-inducible protein DinB